LEDTQQRATEAEAGGNLKQALRILDDYIRAQKYETGKSKARQFMQNLLNSHYLARMDADSRRQYEQWPTTPQQKTILSPTEERKLLKEWMTMHGRDDSWQSMETFRRKSLHPVRIYRGSMIFYNESYGYLHCPGYEVNVRKDRPNTTDKTYPNLVLKHGGAVAFLPDETKWGASFRNLDRVESYLNELWPNWKSVQERFDAAMNEGKEAEAKGDRAAARVAYNNALQVNPNSLEAKQAISILEKADQQERFTAAMQEGQQAEGRGDIDGAIAAYQQALKLKPESREAAEGIARLKAAKKEYAEQLTEAQKSLSKGSWQGIVAAEQAIERSLKIKPGYGPAQELQRKILAEKALWHNCASCGGTGGCPACSKEGRKGTIACRDCQGSGKRQISSVKTCDACGGSGVGKITVAGFIVPAPCVRCGGKGKIATTNSGGCGTCNRTGRIKCPDCNGQGRCRACNGQGKVRQ